MRGALENPWNVGVLHGGHGSHPLGWLPGYKELFQIHYDIMGR
jgi:hypothetical protein